MVKQKAHNKLVEKKFNYTTILIKIAAKLTFTFKSGLITYNLTLICQVLL